MRPVVAAFLLVACSAPAPQHGNAPDVTWTRDVQPLARERCGGCHAPGAIAWPWTEDYGAASAQAGAIAAAVRDRVMPPWQPSSDCEPLAHSRALTDDEIAVFTRWAELGAPEGDAATAPGGAPSVPLGLPRVDEEIALPAYTPAATGSDDYRCFLADPALGAERDLTGIEIAPGQRAMVHHVLVFRITPSVAASLPADATTKGWSCPESAGVPIDGIVGAWVTGTPPMLFPRRTGIPLQANDRLLAEIHYAVRTPHPGQDETRIRMMFSDALVERPSALLALSDSSFTIPPHSASVTASVAYPMDKMGTVFASGATIWGAMPHMHALGRHLRAERTRGGQTDCLVDVPSWDPSWQELYWYAAPDGVRVEPTDVLSVACSWDNPGDRVITWGRGAQDEMCVSYLYVSPGGP